MALVLRPKQRRSCGGPFQLLSAPILIIRAVFLLLIIIWVFILLLACAPSRLFVQHNAGDDNDMPRSLLPLLPPSSSFQKKKLFKEVKQYVRYNKRGTRQVMKAITEVHRDNLRDLNDDIFIRTTSPTTTKNTNNNDDDDSYTGKKEILSILRNAGVTKVDTATVNLLPTWSQVTALYYGDVSSSDQAPVFTAGHETCRMFRDTVPAASALVGTAGLFNSGTNAMTYYLRANLLLPEQQSNENHHGGILTQVPWDKHWLASLRSNHTAKHHQQYHQQYVLPIVVIRDPLTWLQSMCSTPYLVQFSSASTTTSTVEKSNNNSIDRTYQCPHLISDNHYGGSAEVTIPEMTGNRTWESLLHLWNDWYRDYFDQYRIHHQPFLMVRFEDLLFRPQAVLDVVRQCAGAVWKDENSFTYVVDQSKWEHVRFHGPQSNMISAMIKHGNPMRRVKHLTPRDLEIARNVLDPELMKLFRYTYP